MFIFFIFLIVFVNNTYTQSLTGNVVDEQGSPLEAVSVTLPSLELGTITNSDGIFKFLNLPSGIYIVEFSRTGLKKVSKSIDLIHGDVSIKIIMYESPLELPAVTVTAKPQPTNIGNTAQAVSILEEKQLAAIQDQSIMAALQNIPGVSILQSGPFGSKPVVRGLSFQRVVVLENGLRHETQQWDEDDSPGIDVFNANRIEVVRGPSSLLFGSDALGGVVNVVTTESGVISNSQPTLGGIISLNGFSNNNQIAGHMQLHGGTRNIRYNSSLTLRHASDISTPDGSIENSGADELNGNGSITFMPTSANIGITYSRFNQKRYLPFLSEEEGDEETNSYQKTHHERFQFRYLGKTFPTNLEILGSWQNNDAAEFESIDPDIPEIRLLLSTLSFGTKLHHFFSGQASGTIGLSIENQLNKTLGKEPLIPNYNQLNLGGVVYEELNLSNLNFSAGLRFDFRKIHVEEEEKLQAENQTRNYTAFTGTAGLVWHVPFPPLSFALNIGRGWRAPLPQELFVNGLEEGSARYKIGNPNLKPEESIGIDLSARYTRMSIQATITGFYHFIDRYIYLKPTAEIDSASGVKKHEYRQASATFNGYEFSFEIAASGWLSLHGGLDIVLGKNNETNTWVPLIPPVRFILGSRLDFPNSSFLLEPYISLQAKIVMPQNRVDSFESPTPGYSIFDIRFGGEVPLCSKRININGSIENIFNKSYYDHLNLYKDYFLNPGINVTLRLSMPFTIIQVQNDEKK